MSLKASNTYLIWVLGLATPGMYAPSHRRLVLLQRLSPRRNLEHDSWQGSGEGLVPLGQPKSTTSTLRFRAAVGAASVMSRSCAVICREAKPLSRAATMARGFTKGHARVPKRASIAAGSLVLILGMRSCLGAGYPRRGNSPTTSLVQRDTLDPLVGVHGQLVLKKALTSSCVRSARVRPRSKSTPVKFLEA